MAAPVTPDDFPDNATYQRYVLLIENSMEWRDGEHNFYSITTPTQESGTHYEQCTDPEVPYCWCQGDEYGLIYTYAPGITVANHTTSPMFTIKDDLTCHDDQDMMCSWCTPEHYYWDDNGRPMTREKAEEMWWYEQTEYVYNRSYQEFFDECDLPRPPYEPHKNGSHP